MTNISEFDSIREYDKSKGGENKMNTEKGFFADFNSVEDFGEGFGLGYLANHRSERSNQAINAAIETSSIFKTSGTIFEARVTPVVESQAAVRQETAASAEMRDYTDMIQVNSVRAQLASLVQE